MSEQLPYELLVRWDGNGLISAAHIRWQYPTPVGNMEGPPVPVSIIGSDFPLSDLDEVIQSSAILTADAARTAQSDAEAQRDAAIGERDAALTAKAEAEQQRDAALAQVAQLLARTENGEN